MSCKEKVLNIVPKPLKVMFSDSESEFVFSNCTKIDCKLNVIKEELFFLDFEKGTANSITFSVDNSLDNDYEIEIADNIIVKGIDDRAMFYAAMTLKQMVFDSYLDGKSNLPKCKIYDKAKYEYRGYMLDIARHFHGLSTLKKLANILAMLKINVFHLHLSDDQGYRLESERFPLLNQIGSKRLETRRNGIAHEGYLKKSEIKELVEYCSERFIDIMPEIDLPGHTQDLLASYPSLGCLGKKIEVATAFKIKKDVLCAGKEDTYKFVFDLIDEVCEMFPSKYFHIGGDEVPKTRWKNCEACKKRMADNNLTNEEGLQGYFTNRVLNHLNKKGKMVLCWNEILFSGKVTEDCVVQYWRQVSGDNLVHTHMAKGGKIVVSKQTRYYLDMFHAMISLKKLYNHEPSDIKVSEELKSQILGVEAPLWAEAIVTEERLFNHTFPRMMALAERTWSYEKDYDDFERRLENTLGILQAYEINYTSLKDANPNPILAVPYSIKFGRQFLTPTAFAVWIKNKFNKKD